MTKDLLTQAAQKEAEGMYPYSKDRDKWSEEDRRLSNIFPDIQRAAHVKCALLYSERAAGLVEAAEQLRADASDLRMTVRERGFHHLSLDTERCCDKLYKTEADFDAALHAFNSQT